MAFTQEEIEQLWEQQKLVSDRVLREVLGNTMFGILLAFLLPLLVTKFSEEILIRCAIASGAYLFYGIAVYCIWLWGSRSTNTLIGSRYFPFLSASFSSLNLLLLVLIFFWIAILQTGYIAGGNTLAQIIILLFIGGGILTLVRAPFFLKEMIVNSEQLMTRSVIRRLASIQSSTAAIGVLLGFVFGQASYAWVAGFGVAAIGVFLLMPFAIFALYRVVILTKYWWIHSS